MPFFITDDQPTAEADDGVDIDKIRANKLEEIAFSQYLEKSKRALREQRLREQKENQMKEKKLPKSSRPTHLYEQDSFVQTREAKVNTATSQVKNYVSKQTMVQSNDQLKRQMQAMREERERMEAELLRQEQLAAAEKRRLKRMQTSTSQLADDVDAPTQELKVIAQDSSKELPLPRFVDNDEVLSNFDSKTDPITAVLVNTPDKPIRPVRPHRDSIVLNSGVCLNEEEKDDKGKLVINKQGGEPYPAGPNQMRRDELIRLQSSRNELASGGGMRPSDSFYSAAGDKKLIGHTEDSILLESDSVRLKDPSQLPELKDPRLRAKRSTHRAAMYDKVKIQNESEALSMTDSISVEEYRRIQKSLIGDSIKSANSSFMSASVVNTSQKK